jgi:hypothetical protein
VVASLGAADVIQTTRAAARIRPRVRVVCDPVDSNWLSKSPSDDGTISPWTRNLDGKFPVQWPCRQRRDGRIQTVGPGVQLIEPGSGRACAELVHSAEVAG